MDSQQETGLASGALSGASIGTAVLPGIGTAVGALLGGGLGYFSAPKRPKYNIPGTTDQSRAIATETAFGQNPSVTRGQAQADQTAAQDVNMGQQYTNNTGSILNLLRSVNSNRNTANQNLSNQNAQYQMAGRGQLMAANNNYENAYNTAFEYNQAYPNAYQTQSMNNLLQGYGNNFYKMLDSARAAKTLQAGIGYAPSAPTYTNYTGPQYASLTSDDDIPF